MTHAQTLTRFPYASPLGSLLILTRDGAVCALDFADYEERLVRLARKGFGECLIEDGPPDPGVSAALSAYFDGDLTALDAVAVAPRGTAFEETVWRALRTIPPGTTRTYADVAAALGRPGAARAVGRANGLNPVGLIVPCHRVIGANGALTGYAGGVERKAWLLRHEGALVA